MTETLEERAVWTTAFIDNLPDSAFLYIEPVGKKDDQGKTTPRSLRHFPYRDANGAVDLPHLRNALARIPQSNLPADVKAAATKKAQRILAEQENRAGDVEEMEVRYATVPITDIEIRDASANPDGTWTMSGYAAVFGAEAVLRDNKFMRRTESIDPAAFDRVLREQRLDAPDGVVHFNYGHDMLSAIAATDVPANQPGSLILRPDMRGLGFLAKVSQDDMDARRLAVKMRDGVVRQASFMFQVGSDQVTPRELPDGRIEEHRTILEVKRLADICACPQGAYSQTVAQLRSYAAAIGQPIEDGGGRARQPDDFGGGSPVSPVSGGRPAPHLTGDIERARKRFAALAARSR